MTSATMVQTPTRLDIPIKKLNFYTLMRVEFRKLTDTRSGRWLVAFVLALVVVILTWMMIDSSDANRSTFLHYGQTLGPVLGAITPVIGLLAMTSEWTQRSALTTFTLAPRRMSVISAKFLSAIILTAMINIVGLLLAFGSTAIGGLVAGLDPTYAGFGDVARGLLITGVLSSTMGAAFGALAAQTAVAFGAYFLAPTAFSLLSFAVLKEATPWFDIYSSYERLSSSDPFADFAHTLSAVTVWILIPATLGIIRSLRREVK